ncbi:mucin-19-like isoform X1 [Labeo rohita]|uniref:Mucin-19-like isoform X1 n=1 Tax=Labeo rohita TaxID=84645 RepID=A0A498LIC4_LABRO|nr:mucin-19-like isoform X1 [Labeo rohita]
MPSDDVNREPKAGRMDGSDRAFEDGGVDSDFNQRGNFRGGRMFRRGNPPSRRTVVLGDEQMPLEEFEGADIMTTNPAVEVQGKYPLMPVNDDIKHCPLRPRLPLLRTSSSRFQALGSRAVLFISRPGIKTWTNEVLLPRCEVTEAASACLKRMEALFEFVVQGWIQSGIAAAEIPQPTVDNSLATSASTLAIATPPASALAIPTPPASTLAIPTSPASTIAIPTSPASTLAIPTSPASALAIPTPPASTLAIATPPASTLAIPTSPAPTLAIPNPGGNKRKKKNAPTHPIATPPASTLVIATPPAPTVAVPTFPASALAIPTPPAPTVAIPTPPAPTLAIPTPGGNKRKKKKNGKEGIPSEMAPLQFMDYTKTTCLILMKGVPRIYP